MNNCSECPRQCYADRSRTIGYCRMPDKATVSRAALHMWEEPCISGGNGSGTVFFSGCSLKCVFCQNYEISHSNFGKLISTEELYNVCLDLIKAGANNINFVNPTHYIHVLQELNSKYPPFKVPVVYNSGGYELVDSLKLLKGYVNVYLPDMKFFSGEISSKYAGASDYFEYASQAVTEMYSQVGGPVFNDKGIIQRGLIIRHLILPGNIKDSFKILDWISANLPSDVYISIMSQYLPCGDAFKYKEINRKLTTYEYNKVLEHMDFLGLTNGYIQELNSAESSYIPQFDLTGLE